MIALVSVALTQVNKHQTHQRVICIAWQSKSNTFSLSAHELLEKGIGEENNELNLANIHQHEGDVAMPLGGHR